MTPSNYPQTRRPLVYLPACFSPFKITFKTPRNRSHPNRPPWTRGITSLHAKQYAFSYFSLCDRRTRCFLPTNLNCRHVCACYMRSSQRRFFRLSIEIPSTASLRDVYHCITIVSPPVYFLTSNISWSKLSECFSYLGLRLTSELLCRNRPYSSAGFTIVHARATVSCTTFAPMFNLFLIRAPSCPYR